MLTARQSTRSLCFIYFQAFVPYNVQMGRSVRPQQLVKCAVSFTLYIHSFYFDRRQWFISTRIMANIFVSLYLYRGLHIIDIFKT